MLPESKKVLEEKLDVRKSEIYKNEMNKKADESINELRSKLNHEKIFAGIQKNEFLSEETREKLLGIPNLRNQLLQVIRGESVPGVDEARKALLAYLIDIELLKQFEALDNK